MFDRLRGPRGRAQHDVGDPRSMVTRVAEGRTRTLGAPKIEVRVAIFREAVATVELDRTRGSVRIDLRSLRLGVAREEQRIFLSGLDGGRVILLFSPAGR